MKRATKGDIKRAASLLSRLHNLQSDIYYFEDHLDDKGLKSIAELVVESGFEMDVSQEKMKDAIKDLQKSNYGVQ